jgi:ribosomal protein L11 methyltransferase
LQQELEAHLKQLSSIFGADHGEAELKIRVIDEEDWASKWLPFFQPLKIGPVWIRPRAKNVRLAAGEQEIILDPGMAFGTGHHESTQQCLESILLLRPSLQDDGPVLDLGTGSGILAIFAAKVGFKKILALDVDPVAVETALRNIRTNRLENFIQASNVPLRSLKRHFRLILANLSRPLLQDLIEEILLHMDRDGWLVAAGHLTGESDALLGSFCSKGLQLVHQKNKNEWGCLIFKREFAR